MDRAELDRLAVTLAKSNPGREQVFHSLRVRGFSALETVYVVSRVFDMSLAEAKSAIYASHAWRDQNKKWQHLHSELTQPPED